MPSKPLNWLYRIIYTRNPFAGNSMMIKKSFLEKVGLFPFPDDVGHDYWLVACSCLFGGFNYIDNPITKRRAHESNVTGIKFEEGNFVQKVARRLFVPHNRQQLRENTQQSLACLNHLLERFSLDREEKDALLNLNTILEGRLARPLSVRRLRGFKRFISCYHLIYFDEIHISFFRLMSYLI